MAVCSCCCQKAHEQFGWVQSLLPTGWITKTETDWQMETKRWKEGQRWQMGHRTFRRTWLHQSWCMCLCVAARGAYHTGRKLKQQVQFAHLIRSVRERMGERYKEWERPLRNRCNFRAAKKQLKMLLITLAGHHKIGFLHCHSECPLQIT